MAFFLNEKFDARPATDGSACQKHCNGLLQIILAAGLGTLATTLVRGTVDHLYDGGGELGLTFSECVRKPLS